MNARSICSYSPARSTAAVKKLAASYAAHLKASDANLADVCFTAAVGRPHTLPSGWPYSLTIASHVASDCRHLPPGNRPAGSSPARSTPITPCRSAFCSRGRVPNTSAWGGNSTTRNRRFVASWMSATNCSAVNLNIPCWTCCMENRSTERHRCWIRRPTPSRPCSPSRWLCFVCGNRGESRPRS